MVRVNVLSRPGMWDSKVYGIPIPQLDQMPAGLIPIYFMSEKALTQGRRVFDAEERARVELARYRCYLLGLPEDLLADTPEEVVRIWCTRSATLRYEYDDAICGGLLRATMEAELSKDRSLPGRVFRRLERSFSRVFFVNTFLKGDEKAAADVGVPLDAKDKALYAATMAAIVGQTVGHRVAARLPFVGELADQLLITRLRRQLTEYGHAEFTTDAAKYRQAAA
jgi:hypothetical protein